MGKKNKNGSKSGKTDISKEQRIQNKIQKTKLKKDKLLKNESKTSKKMIFDDGEAPTTLAHVNDKTKVKNSSKQKGNKISQKQDNSNINKKIIFGDDNDEPQEVYVNKTVANKNKKKNQSNEEAPKDEDIDKFCDEIDEEDNKQFNIWVELLEAKLNSNKKKK